jgi:hypothetical protein
MWDMRYDYFNGIKHSIDLGFLNAYMEVVSANRSLSNMWTPLNYEIRTREMNCATYNENYLKTWFSFLIPLIICVSFLVTFLLNVSSIIIEKETKVKVRYDFQIEF